VPSSWATAIYTHLGLVRRILGLCVTISVPNAVSHHMMGLGYFTAIIDDSALSMISGNHPNPVHRNHKDQMTSTSVWVVAEDSS
jgi:hypothetical protein